MANDCGNDKATMVFTITELNPVNDTFFIQTDALRFVSTQGTESNIQGAGTKVYVDGRDNSNTRDTYEKNKISQVSVDVTSPGDSTYSSEPLLGGRYNTGALNSPDIDFCEFITYDTGDFDTIRAIVDTNQNNFYKAYKKFSTGLLDSYPGAVGAYSLRRLSSSYDGPLIEIKESDSGNTHDIYARGNGELNTGEMYHIEPANTQNTLRISKWYDQVETGKDLVQATDGDQPKIKKASSDGSTHDGLIVTVGDKPAIEFFDSNSKFIRTSSKFSFDDFFILNVIKASVHSGNDPFVWSIADPSDTEYQYLANLNASNDYYIRRDSGGSNINQYVGSHKDFEGPTTISLSYDGSSTVFKMRGKVEDERSLTTVYGASNQSINLGAGASGGNPFRGKQQEFLVYPSDMRTKVAGIEKNINKFYNIYEQPLLDVVPDAQVAYSLRRLRSDYTGPAINVFNGTDYKDIYFRANGTLDTSAISSFCGSNDGRVAVWYDQSGNQNNATRDLNNARPKIYDGTNGILTDNNGKVTLEFVVDTLSLDSEIVLNSNDPDKFMISIVAESIPTTSNNQGEYFGEGSLNFFSYGEVSGKYRFRHTTTTNGNVNTEFDEPSGNSEDEIAALSLYAANDVKNMRFNNADLTSSGSGAAWSDSSNGVIKIDTVGRAYARDYSGMYSEFIVWDDYGTGLGLVHPNQNHYYSIY